MGLEWLKVLPGWCTSRTQRGVDKCPGSVYRACSNLMARAAGRQVLPGAEVPYED